MLENKITLLQCSFLIVDFNARNNEYLDGYQKQRPVPYEQREFSGKKMLPPNFRLLFGRPNPAICRRLLLSTFWPVIAFTLSFKPRDGLSAGLNFPGTKKTSISKCESGKRSLMSLMVRLMSKDLLAKPVLNVC